MTKINLKLSVKLPWWIKGYVVWLALVSVIRGREEDFSDRLIEMILRHSKYEVGQ